MKTTTTESVHDVDAVALLRAIRDVQADEMQGMTSEQQIAYYRAKAQELIQRLQRLQEQTPPLLHPA